MGNEIHYRLNDRDEIVFVNQAWDQFAMANAGGHLIAAQVLGRSLWEFISDITTQALYQDILSRARSGRSIRFPLRCDSPGVRRILEMHVTCGPDRVADIRVRTIAEKPCPPQPLLDAARPHSDDLLQVCGWCKKVNIGGRWVEVEEAVSARGLFDRSLLPDVTHGICDLCYKRMSATLND